MYPVLFRIPIFGGVTITSYGVLVASAFVAGIFWVSHESRRIGQDPAKATDLVFYIILSAIVGSRLLHVLVSERQRFFENPLVFFRIWEGGLVFYGGLIASFIVGVWYVRRHRMPVLVTMDVFAPAIALGHAIGRMGCFLVGCCYGRAVDHPAWYGVTFPAHPNGFAPPGIPLYPTQLMECIGELVIFSVLFALRYYKRFDGQVMATYIMLYAALRSFTEYFRGDVARGFLIEPWISTSQFISILVFVIGVLMYVKLWPRAEDR